MPGTVLGVKERAGNKTEFFTHIALNMPMGQTEKQPLSNLYNVYIRK